MQHQNYNAESLSDYSKLVLLGKLAPFRRIISTYLTNSFERAGGLSICKSSKYSQIEKVSASQRIKGLLINPKNTLSYVNQYYKKNYKYTLPNQISREFGLKGFKARQSSFRFLKKIYVISFVRIAKALLELFKFNNQNNPSLIESAVYIFNIVPGNLSKESLGGKDLENWLRNNYLEPKTTIYHSHLNTRFSCSSTSKYVPSFLPRVSILIKVFILITAIIKFFIYFLLSLTGNWRQLFMLDDWIYSQVFKWTKTDKIYKKYIFPFQGDQYRPCWSWIAEARGASIVQLNYAANIVPSLDMKYHDTDNLNTSTWTEIIPFCDKFVKTLQAEVKNKVYPTKIISAPPVLYIDNPCEALPTGCKPMLAVFDVQPLSQEKYIGITEINDYVVTKNLDPIFTNRKFITDCVDLAEEKGFTLITKQKRYDKRIHSAYTDLLNDLQERGKLICLDPSIAPSRIVEASTATITLPFTTIGYNTDLNSNICFYDPISKLSDSHQSSFGVPLFTSKVHLDCWLTNILDRKINHGYDKS